MKYLKTYEAKKNPYSIDTAESVSFYKIKKSDEKKKFKILANYFGVDAVAGCVADIGTNLEFGMVEKNGMIVLFCIDNDFIDNRSYGRITIGYNPETKELDYDGVDLEFEFDYHPTNNNGNFDPQQFKANVERLKEWIKNPQLYQIYLAAKQYNL